MGKSMIIEAQDSSLVYENGQKGVLGKLSGVFANFRTGTRNGGRLYNEELVDKRIFGNEDVMEALETRTLFGELDHPEGDRCETLAQNAAVSIIKLEKDAEEGVVKGEALILDTPSGRTLKALVDSGAHMGISSRGIGEEIISEGQTIIDPDTYDFITFDIVVTPANKGARLSLVEGKQRDTKLYKSIEKEINECNSLNQLDQLSRVVENHIPVGKAKLNKLIETKIATLTSDEDITDEQSEDINVGNEDIIPEKVQESNAKEQIKAILNEQKLANKELQDASAKLLEENKALLERVEKAEKSNKLLQAKLAESRKVEKEAKLSSNKLEENNNEIVRKLNKINETKIKNLEETYKNEIVSLKESLEAKEAEYGKLLEANKKLGEKMVESKNKLDETNSKLGEMTSKLEEANSLVNEKANQVKLLENQLKDAKTANQVKLEESKKQQNQEVVSLRNQLEEAQSHISKLTEANDRIAKLPFNVTKANLKFESLQASEMLSDDDQALFNTMVGMNQK